MEIILIGQPTTDKEQSKMENYRKRVIKTIEAIDFDEVHAFLKLFPKYRKVYFQESNQRESFKMEDEDMESISKLEWFRGKFIDLIYILETHNMYNEMIDITKDIRNFEMKRHEIFICNENFTVYEVKSEKNENGYYAECNICGKKQGFKNKKEIYKPREHEKKCKQCLNYFKINYIPEVDDTYQFKILKIVEKYEDIKLLLINEYEDERPYFKIKVENNTFILDDEGICDVELKKSISLNVLKKLSSILEDFHEKILN